MTAIHIYDLSDQDDRAEYTNATNATAAIVALDEVREMLRQYWKYEDLEGWDVNALIDEIYRKFFELAGAVLEATR
jgi:hypothetical protein